MDRDAAVEAAREKIFDAFEVHYSDEPAGFECDGTIENAAIVALIAAVEERDRVRYEQVIRAARRASLYNTFVDTEIQHAEHLIDLRDALDALGEGEGLK